MAVFSYPYTDSYTDRYYHDDEIVDESQDYIEVVARAHQERAARARQAAFEARRPPHGHPIRREAYYPRGIPEFQDFDEYYEYPPPRARYESVQHRPIYERAPIRRPAPRSTQSRDHDLEAQFLRDLAIEDYDAAFEEWKASRRQSRRAPQPEQPRPVVARSAPRRQQVAPAHPTHTVFRIQPNTPVAAPAPHPRSAPVDLLALLGLDTPEPTRAPRPAVRREEPPAEVQELLSLFGLAPPAPKPTPRSRPQHQTQQPEIQDFLSLFGIDASALNHTAKPNAPAKPAAQQATAAPQVPAQLQDIFSIFGFPGAASESQQSVSQPKAQAPAQPQTAASSNEEQQGFPQAMEFFQALQSAFGQQLGAGAYGSPSVGPSASTAQAGPSCTSSAPPASAAASQSQSRPQTQEEREHAHIEAELLKQAIAASLETPSNERPPSPTHSDKGKNKAVSIPTLTPSETLTTLERTFADLTDGSFDFPPVIDFAPAPTSRSASPTPGPELAHTPRNAALRSQTNALNVLLAKVDAVEGEEGSDVRARRRDLAKSVEAALDDLDVLTWSKWRAERAQGQGQPEPEVEVKGYDVETPETAQEPVEEAEKSDEEGFDVVTVEAKPESEHEDEEKKEGGN